MPRQLDPRIRDILVEHGEDPNDKQNVLWDCHGHVGGLSQDAIERIAARAGITFDPPKILRAERDEAVILVHGELKGRSAIGTSANASSASTIASLAEQAAYVWAMATKRARDRLVLKLIGLHGLLYSEEEADAFGKRPAQVSDDARPNGAEPPAGPVKSSRQAKKDGDWDQIAAGIASCRDTAALLDWVSLVQAPLQRLSPAWQAEAREAWAKALASKLVEECHQPSEVRQWGVDYAAGIEAMPMEWINTARQVCSEHVRALKAAQPVEVMA
jgi:hypothetical protein